MTEYQPDVAERIQRVEHHLIPSETFRNLVTRRYSIEESMTRYSVPGLSVAIINDGRLEWAKGYGVRQAGQSEPVTTETLFQCASSCKRCSTQLPTSINGLITHRPNQHP